MDKIEYVILVDGRDNEIGKEEKLAAHQKGLLHRAFSVFLYRNSPDGIQILLQQRESHKYHCGGLWANTCCSHPRHGENITDAGVRRLKEEMGIDLSSLLTDVGSFTYKAVFDNGLTEHEVDHVLVAPFDADDISFNPEEVESVRWITLEELDRAFIENAGQFTPWFKPALTLAREKFFNPLSSK